MKIAEDLIVDHNDDKIHHVKKHDWRLEIAETKLIRDLGPRNDDMWHIGHIPIDLMALWVKEAGLKWDDRAAVRDLIEKKLLSGEFNALRPHEGKFK